MNEESSEETKWEIGHWKKKNKAEKEEEGLIGLTELHVKMQS